MDKLLPSKGNRNTWLTAMLAVLAVGAWVIRGVVSGDWTGLEWLMGELAVVSGASALRARGEYAYSGDEE
jgi:hypothetical protein